MLNEDLRKQMGEAFEQGDYTKALELSQQLDEQILKYTRYEIKTIGQNAGTDKYVKVC